MSYSVRIGTLLLFGLLFSNSIYGQLRIVARNYYASDTSSTSGIIINDEGPVKNAEYCHLIENGVLKLLSPDDIVEYGLENGARYFSKSIEINNITKQVFLELLVDGDLSLYSYAANGLKAYYVEKGDSSELVELSKKAKEPGSVSFRDYLGSITLDCEVMLGESESLDFTRTFLMKYVQKYNLCEEGGLYGIRYGLRLGSGAVRLFPGIGAGSEFLSNMDYSNYLLSSAGVFIEYPIGLGNYSLIGEMGISKFTISSTGNIGVFEYGLSVESIRLDLPIMVRYTSIGKNFNTYFEAGGVVAYNVLSDSYLYKAIPDGNIIDIEKVNTNELQTPVQFGPLIGAGIELPAFNKFSLLFDLRYGMCLSIGDLTLSNSFLQISTGIIF